jgi:hypothetical protein
MERTIQGNPQITGRIRPASFSGVLGWGLRGGLAGTLAMDLVLMVVMAALGLPASTCFSIVGNTVARFFSIQNVEMGRAIQMGITTHYIVGPVIGAVFGLLVTRVKALRVNNLKKSILLGILYVEILSQPLLAMTPILLKMTAPATLQWYGGSFVMHLVAGMILGAVVGRGLQQGSHTGQIQVRSITLKGVES